MMDHRAVGRYATALLFLAEEHGGLEAVDKDFEKIRQFVEELPAISHLVVNSTISRDEKDDFIDKIVPSGTSPLLVHFLKVLIKKRRFQDLVFIQEKFHELVEKKQGIQEVTVLSAAPLSPQNETRLASVLKKKLRSDVRLITEIDPELLGGLIIRFDGSEINTSFRNRLVELRQKLMG